VADSEHFAECIKARAANKERLLSTDVEHFIKVMTIWREKFLQSATLPIVGASEADLNAIKRLRRLSRGRAGFHFSGSSSTLTHIQIEKETAMSLQIRRVVSGHTADG
jgi:hypothetical protein